MKTSELIFTALGEASMCWSETPKGVFESNKAEEIGKSLLIELRNKCERIGTIIDDLDNLSRGLNLAIPDRLHVEAIRSALPEKVKLLKSEFVELTGENPWE